MSDNWDQSGASDDFMDVGLPACTFGAIGVVHGGTITRVQKRPDTDMNGEVRTWPDGRAKDVYVFELDGVKALWVRGNMVKAIREALGAAHLQATGTRIEVKHYAVGTPPKPGLNPPKLFMCRVLRPGDAPDPNAEPAPAAQQLQPAVTGGQSNVTPTTTAPW